LQAEQQSIDPESVAESPALPADPVVPSITDETANDETAALTVVAN
jgi:hypothetical protein